MTATTDGAVPASPIIKVREFLDGFLNTLQVWVRPIALLIARLYMANIFFNSGLTKLSNWDTTLFLFELEYKVTWPSVEIAAFAGTAGELILPVLLALGLGTRFAAAGLFVMSAVIQFGVYDIPDIHYPWMIIFGILALNGGGALSLDRLIGPFLGFKARG